jgi:hypothetical protein
METHMAVQNYRFTVHAYLHGDAHGVAEVDNHKGDNGEELLPRHRHLGRSIKLRKITNVKGTVSRDFRLSVFFPSINPI